MQHEPYLWDKSGPVVPFIAQLERALAARRAEVLRAGFRRRRRVSRMVWGIAAVAAAVAAAVVIWLCLTVGSDRPLAAPPNVPGVAIEPVRPDAPRNESTVPGETSPVATTPVGAATESALDALAEPLAPKSK